LNSPKKNLDQKAQEEMFVDRAAHLFLALAGLKPLPAAKHKNRLSRPSLKNLGQS